MAQVTVERDALFKAPEATKLKAGQWVRVAHDAKLIGGRVWQYGKIGCVYNGQLVDIMYDGEHESSDHVPTFQVLSAADEE